MIRRVSMVLALAVVLGVPMVAAADVGVVAIQVTGPNAGKVRGEIAGALPEGLSASELNKAEKLGAKRVVPGAKRQKAITALATTSMKAGRAAVVLVTVKGKKAQVLVIDTEAGSTLLDETMSVSDAPLSIAGALGPVAEKFEPREEKPIAKGGGDEPAPPDTAGGGEGGGGGGGGGGGTGVSKHAGGGAAMSGAGPMVVVSGGLALGGRSMSYGGTTGGFLGDYSVFGAFMFQIGARVQPLWKKPGLLGGLGVYFDFGQALGLSSSTSGGAALDTTLREWDVGARLRFGKEQGKNVGASLAYGSSEMTFSNEPNDGRLYPDATYGYLRLGGDGRYSINPKMNLDGGVGIRIVVAKGGFEKGFGSASAFGFDVGVGVTYKLKPAIDLTGRFALADYSWSLSNGTMYMASSANDLFYSVGVGAVYRH